MKWLSGLLITLVLFTPVSAYQAGDVSGYFLLSSLDVSATTSPNRLLHGDASTGQMTEMLVEGASTYASWSGWSPDGSTFAYLAPARLRTRYYELWIANADATNARTPFLDLELTVVAAQWNPQFNILAIATRTTGDPIGEDGLYLFNAQTGRLIFVRAEIFDESTRLDWARGGYLLAYTNEARTLAIYDTQTSSYSAIAPNVEIHPLSAEPSGWSAQDSTYVFTNLFQDRLYVVPTDGSAPLREIAFPNTASVRFAPLRDEVIGWRDQTLVALNLADDQQRELVTQAEADYGLLADQWLVYTSLLDSDFGLAEQCMLAPLDSSQPPRPLREILSNAPWTHSRCQVLEGQQHLAIMITTQPISLEALPDDLTYTLSVVPASLGAAFLITGNYAGFARAPLAFTPTRAQLAFVEGSDFVIYGLRGERQVMIPVDGLNLASDTVQYHIQWQP